MHTIKLDVSDNVYDKVMRYLEGLPQKEITINVDDEDRKVIKKFHSISLKTKGFSFNRDEANAR